MAEPNILLVEGKEDLHVFASLMRYHNRDRLFHIVEQEGIENLKTNLPVYLKASDLRAIGVVIDADQDVLSRWQSIRDILIGAGYTVPTALTADGLIIDTSPKVGVWIMPDNVATGNMERFASILVPLEDQLWPKAQQIVGEIPANLRRFSEADIPKAEIHTWLAWQEEPGRSIGTAITLRYLHGESDLAVRFIDWLVRLRGEVL